MTTNIGILLTNTGTPDAPTTGAVRRYLREFLSDKRIVQLPRIVWLPILYGAILPLRPKRSAKLYQRIWTSDGSPMRSEMQQIRTALREKAAARLAHAQQTTKVCVEVGMNYGNPSIRDGLEKLRQQNVDKIIVLPLYPQYSNTTTASSFDRVTNSLKKWPSLPDFHLIKSYASHPAYIAALARSVQTTRAQAGAHEHLLISFHGIPERFVEKGDPYQQQCEQTAQLLAAALELDKNEWTLCYQSQFGYDKWLKPSTQALFTELPQRGVHTLDIICPGFSVDCLETLEEIAIAGQKSFIEAGGKALRYIPALNTAHDHIDAMLALIDNHL